MQEIKTRFLVISDTHAQKKPSLPDIPVEVAINCGDLTNESKLDEFRESIDLLRRINAPLKLVIAGNHDFTLDNKMFQKKRKEAEAVFSISPELMKREYGDCGDARQLFEKAKGGDNIVFLDEGVHRFHLANGATLTVYASPFTPSVEADWGFQYKRGKHHNYAISEDVDIVITHGPPRGILDLTDSKQRGGCEHLFAAVASARPRLHCFGHIHEGWGAKLVSWRRRTQQQQPTSETPTHFNAIDNDKSAVLDTLATLRGGKWDTAKDIAEKEERLTVLRNAGYRATQCCSASEHPIVPEQTTLFVNAAIESTHDAQAQLPWVIDIELPATAY